MSLMLVRERDQGLDKLEGADRITSSLWCGVRYVWSALEGEADEEVFE
jgi:hypothetical protein